MLLAAVSWTGAAGDNQWTTPGNWSGGVLPGPADDVTINVAGNPTIMLGSGTQSIHSLVVGDPLQITSGVLAVATTAQLSTNLTLAGGVLAGGTYETSNGSMVVLTPTGGMLVDLTMDCEIDATASHAFADVQLGLVLNATALIGGPGATLSSLVFLGTQTLSGTGTVLFGSVYASGAATDPNQLPIEPGLLLSQPGSSLTIGPGITVSGGGFGFLGVGADAIIGGSTDVSVVNQGTIDAAVFGAIDIIAQSFTNFGTVGHGPSFSSLGILNLVQVAGGSAAINGALESSVTITGGNVQFGQDPFLSGAPPPSPPPEFPPNTFFLGIPSVTLSGQGVLSVPRGEAFVLSGPLLFAGGNPVINLPSDNSMPGGLILSQDVACTATSGSAAIRSTGGGAIPGIIDLGNVPPNDGTSSAARDFTVTGNSDLVVSGTIYGGGLRKDGTGELELESPSAFTGGTTLANGVTQIDDPAALGAGPVTFAGGMLALRTGGVAISNTIMVDAANTIALDVGAEPMQMAIPELGTALDVTGIAGGSLTLTGSVTLQNNLDIDNTVPLTINGVITGAFGITKADTGTLILAGSSSNTYTGTTEVEGGTLLLDKTGGAVAIAGALSVVPFSTPSVATSATVGLLAGQQIPSSTALSFDSTNGTATFDLNGFNQSVQSLSVTGGNTAANGRAVIGDSPTNAAAGGWVTASSLSIASGQTLDLTGNNLQVQYASGSDPIAAIRQYLVSGYSGGSWTGTGIISSTAAAAGRTLGYADSADNIVGGLASNTILVKYTYPGDANLDGSVNFSDLVILAQHYGASATWDQGEFSYGGKVNFADLVALAQNYNKSVGTAAVSASAAALTPSVDAAATASDGAANSQRRSARHGGRRDSVYSNK